MAKYNFQAQGKLALMTAAEAGVVGGAMLVTTKFLNFNTLFKNQIAKDPAYAEKWFIKHQGAVKFGAGIIAAIHVPNPWLRLAFMGVAVVGLIEEVRTLAVDKATGESFFDKVGWKSTTGNRVTDAELLLAAQQVSGATNPTEEYPTYVGAPQNPTTEYPTFVGNWGMQDDLGGATSVGRW